MKQILKYFWKFLGVTFLIEILWYIVCFSIGYFYFPGLMRHISMIGFLVIPFITAYHTMWKQIDELESFIEAQFYLNNTKLTPNNKDDIKVENPKKNPKIKKSNKEKNNLKIEIKKEEPKVDLNLNKLVNNDEEEF